MSQSTHSEDWSYDDNMADKGPLLTSCVIFYLSIGAAIFQILEEPNYMSARDKYILQKEQILKKFSCLTKSDLDQILEVQYYSTCFIVFAAKEIDQQSTHSFLRKKYLSQI